MSRHCRYSTVGVSSRDQRVVALAIVAGTAFHSASGQHVCQLVVSISFVHLKYVGCDVVSMFRFSRDSCVELLMGDYVKFAWNQIGLCSYNLCR